jgi:hypothetical protein
MRGECALYVMGKRGKTPANAGISAALQATGNLDAAAICPYTSAVPSAHFSKFALRIGGTAGMDVFLTLGADPQ